MKLLHRFALKVSDSEVSRAKLTVYRSFPSLLGNLIYQFETWCIMLKNKTYYDELIFLKSTILVILVAPGPITHPLAHKQLGIDPSSWTGRSLIGLYSQR